MLHKASSRSELEAFPELPQVNAGDHDVHDEDDEAAMFNVDRYAPHKPTLYRDTSHTELDQFPKLPSLHSTDDFERTPTYNQNPSRREREISFSVPDVNSLPPLPDSPS